MHISKTWTAVSLVALTCAAAATWSGAPSIANDEAPTAPSEGEPGTPRHGVALPPRQAPARPVSPSSRSVAVLQYESFEELLEEARVLTPEERKLQLEALDRTLDEERWVERANADELSPEERDQLAAFMRKRNALSVANAETLLASLRPEGEGAAPTSGAVPGDQEQEEEE